MAYPFATIGVLPSVIIGSIPPIIPSLLFLVLFASCAGRDNKRSYRKFILLLLLPTIPLFLVSIADEYRIRYKHALSASSSPSYVDATNGGSIEYALVTGASSGIGRSIAIQLARNGISLILVARDKRTDDKPIDELDVLAEQLKLNFTVSVESFRADFSRPGEARRLHAATSAAKLSVSQLVLAAGWGPSKSHMLLGDDENAIESVIRINVESTAVLSSLYGKDMAALVEERRDRKGMTIPPHVLIVSSVVGTAPGLPDAALYGATKAFGLSLAQGISLELEPLGIGVTALCPGATATAFGANGDMADAAIWNFPFSVSNADDVAASAVRSMLRGGGVVMPGFMNYITFRVLAPLVPSRIAMQFYKFCWDPWPFSFPPGWRPDNVERRKSGGTGEEL